MYPVYPQQNPQPYPDRLAQLQGQYMQAVPQPQNPAPAVNQGLLWVQGENAARSYLVAPNSTVLLMDSDVSKFYLKSADSAGMPSLRIFEYKELPQNPTHGLNPASDGMADKYVTREEYNSLRAEYAELMGRLESLINAEESAKRAAPKGNTVKGKGGNADGQPTV